MKARTILLTGASGKFGQVLVRHFLSVGDRIIATARTEASLQALRDEHVACHERFCGVLVDLTAPDGVATLGGTLEEKNIKPDCLINNARSISFLKIEENGTVSRENFSNEYLLDVIVPYELTMALVGQDGGCLRRVVNIGSQYGTVASNPNLYVTPLMQSPIHYGVAKAALVHLTKELAVRLAQKGVQVNCVAFGGVEGRVDNAFKERYAKLCPLGRMLREDEIVGPIDMMLSDQCSGVTGHVLAVDGGWSLW